MTIYADGVLMRVWIILIPVALLSLNSYAFNAYKCKDENGNTVFSQTLCPDTKSEFIQVSPATGENAPVNRGKSLTQRLNSAAATKASHNNPARTGSQVKMSSSSTESSKAKLSGRNAKLCSHNKEEVSALGLKMRSGYSAKQGEILRVKLKMAKKNVKHYCN